MEVFKEDTSIKLLLGGSLMRIPPSDEIQHTSCCMMPLRISLAKIIHDVLETFDHATNTFSYVYEPNIHMVVFECIKVMKDKRYAYFIEFPPIYCIAAILDPGVKLQGLTNLLTYYYDQLGTIYDVPNYVNKCKLILERLCQDYGPAIQQEPVGSSKGKSRFGFLGRVVKKHRPDSSSSSLSSNVGIDEYLSYQFETKDDFHIIQWWKNHSSKFPDLARIAQDILGIPTSTVTSESTFSVGRRVLDEKRCHLTPQSIEMC
ncbi:Zinc finger BED domain-containing protein RICESLEEPER 3, partial [Bienertia sinuspersici]